MSFNDRLAQSVANSTAQRLVEDCFIFRPANCSLTSCGSPSEWDAGVENFAKWVRKYFRPPVDKRPSADIGSTLFHSVASC